MYSSVAMSYDGAYTIVWSGNGNQLNQVDTSGVFYQQYNAAGATVGSETRLNYTTDGDQQVPSIACDANGNAVVAWTGVASSGATDVYTKNIAGHGKFSWYPS